MYRIVFNLIEILNYESRLFFTPSLSLSLSLAISIYLSIFISFSLSASYSRTCVGLNM